LALDRRPIKNRTSIIHALDVEDLDSALKIAKRVEGYVDAIKLSWPLVMLDGARVINIVKSTVELPVITDFKIADIPAISAKIVRYALDNGTDGITLQGFVGRDTMDECVKVAHKSAAATFIVTEMSHPGAERFMQPVGDKIALMARELGSDGIVAPATRPERTREYRKIIGSDMMIMSPGVGAQGANVGDAIKAGANFEVIGRRIYEAQDPGSAAKQFSETISRIKKETITVRN
jgi:orotidine-5'-phosphate decarboxylase